MRPTLLITNDFPPRVGGIQSYVYELARRLPHDRLVVLASDHPGAGAFDAQQPFPVVRHPRSVLLPTPAVVRTARRLIAQYGCTAVWFGAAAPLALMSQALRRDGIERIVASTHGHEVGWSMVPGTRQLLRRIGSTVDIVTYVSRYSRRRISSALGPGAALEALSPGVDSARFQPEPSVRAAMRSRYGLGSSPTVVCVSRLVPRKGQDRLIAVWPEVRASVPGARLLVVGGGEDEARLRRLASASSVANAITITGSVPSEQIPQHYQAGDVFAMPCRTRGHGLDVEGLGIVFLEGSASGLPVVAGDSGGAPETVIEGRTGHVVDGRDPAALASALVGLLSDPERAALMGAAGRRWVRDTWTWESSAERLIGLLGD